MTQDLLTDPLLSNVPVHEGYKVLGGVVLYQKLGRGGMGAVYRGRHLRLDVDVAVKVMVPPAGGTAEEADVFLKRFLREARTAAAVRHGNLIRVMDVNAEAGVHYLVMDYIDGESAAERLERKGRFSEQEVVEICLGAAEGLGAAHSQGIVHRDVKPDNILIDKNGNVVVADLGLAKAYGREGRGRTQVTQTGHVMGTPEYMSPEQFAPGGTVGPASDVWSLGVTLYQLLTARLPWTGANVFEIADSVRKTKLPDPKESCEGLSDGVCRIVRKAAQKEAWERYADCSEIAKALRKHLDSITTSPGNFLADAEAGTPRLAIVSVSPPDQETITLIAAADLERSVPRARREGRASTPRLDEVIEKRMDLEEWVHRLEREEPDADEGVLAEIRKHLRIAEAAEGKDVAAALRRVERAERAVEGLQGQQERERRQWEAELKSWEEYERAELRRCQEERVRLENERAERKRREEEAARSTEEQAQRAELERRKREEDDAKRKAEVARQVVERKREEQQKRMELEARRKREWDRFERERRERDSWVLRDWQKWQQQDRSKTPSREGIPPYRRMCGGCGEEVDAWDTRPVARGPFGCLELLCLACYELSFSCPGCSRPYDPRTMPATKTADPEPGGFMCPTCQAQMSPFHAVRVLDELIQRASANAFAYFERAWVKLRTGDRNGAMQDFDTLIQLVPHDAYAIHLRGLARQARGDVPNAQEDFKTAHRLGYSPQGIGTVPGGAAAMRGSAHMANKASRCPICLGEADVHSVADCWEIRCEGQCGHYFIDEALFTRLTGPDDGMLDTLRRGAFGLLMSGKGRSRGQPLKLRDGPKKDSVAQ